MSLSAQADVSEFRLSMLINDTRYRSYTFQFLALIFLICIDGFFGMELIAELSCSRFGYFYTVFWVSRRVMILISV